MKEATLIKIDGTEVPGKITVGWGCTVTAESTPINTGIQLVTPTITDGDDAIYNLAGQRVSTPSKGSIYIKNGKKFIAR